MAQEQIIYDQYLTVMGPPSMNPELLNAVHMFVTGDLPEVVLTDGTQLSDVMEPVAIRFQSNPFLTDGLMEQSVSPKSPHVTIDVDPCLLGTYDPNNPPVEIFHRAAAMAEAVSVAEWLTSGGIPVNTDQLQFMISAQLNRLSKGSGIEE